MQILKKKIIIIMVDLNVKVAKEQDSEINQFLVSGTVETLVDIEKLKRKY